MPHTVSAALQAHLDDYGIAHTLAEWWEVKPASMGVLGFTSHDQDLTFDGGTGTGSIVHRAPTGFVRSALRSSADQMLATINIQSFISDDAISDHDIRAGRYELAEVWWGVTNWAALGQGVIKLFRGRVGRIILRDWGYEFELRSMLDEFGGAQVGKIMEGNTVDAIGKFLPGADAVANP